MKEKLINNLSVRKVYLKILLIMRLTLLLLTISTFSICADTFSQSEKIGVEFRNVTIREAFDKIEKETGYKFFYLEEHIDDTKKLFVESENYTVPEFLDFVFSENEYKYKIFDEKIVVITPLVQAEQEITIKGTVVDAEGNPLPGVNIVEKGTTNGAVANLDGEYSISVNSPNAILSFSFIGYLQEEIEVAGQTQINITMIENIQSLEEIVVIGYGSQVKRHVTGSVTQVDVEQMEAQPNSNVGQALRGRVAGVQFMDNGRPGQSGEILVRGQRSINAGNDPLVIVDGAFFPVDFDEGGLADINPNDIESIEILKDASAAAIYGSRAANGVILITTKKGKAEKPTISFNTYYGVSDWSHKINLYSPDSYLQRRADYMTQNGITPDPNNPYDLEENELEMYNAGKSIDPWEAVSQSASQQSYNLSVSGHSEKTSYFISGNYVNEEGLIYNDRASRLSTRVNLENQITKWLKIGVSSQYSQRDETGVNASLMNAYWLSPYAKLYYDEAETDLVFYPVYGETLVSNPLFNAKQIDNEEISNNLFASAYALIDFPFIQGLTYRFNYNPNLRWDHDYAFTPIYDRDGVKRAGEGTKYNRNRWNWQMENILTYEKIFGEHALDLTLVYGVDHSEWESTEIEAEGFANDKNGWNNLDIAQTKNVDTEAAEKDGISSMARLNYRLKERYMLTMTVRRDGSSVFGENNKFGVFPSIATAWIVSDENWMQSSFLDMLKLRISYGEVGNQSISSYVSLDQSESENYVFGDGSNTYIGIYPNPDYMPNPNLRWESTVSSNFAVDFALFGNRVSGTIEYYDMNTKDLLLYRSLPDMTGFYGILTNLGKTSNKGIEFSLSTVNLSSQDFKWESSIVMSSNKNEITGLYGSDVDGDGKEDDDIANKWFIGQPIDVTFDYEFDGIYQEGDAMPEGYTAGWVKVKDQDGDGEITTDDRTVLGQKQPKIRWGINNTVTYKDFTLSFFINGMHGFENELNLLDPGNSKGFSFPGRSINSLDAGYWTPENKSNTRPSLNYTNPLGMNYYQSRNFVRIQDVTLSYNVPFSILEKLNFSNLRVYISGRNLATFTEWEGPDPESGYNQLNSLYPTSRTIVGGINLSF